MPVETLMQWISQHGYAGIFLLLMLGIVGLPATDETLTAPRFRLPSLRSVRRWMSNHGSHFISRNLIVTLIITTVTAITTVTTSSRSKLHVSVARLIVAPGPVVERIYPLKWKYSATMS
ncbi:MAG: hypothetical protein AB7U82_17260 [Blastocatellales bacterium]